MQWTILNVSIPVHDLNKSKEFYEMILGLQKNEGNKYQSLFKNEENIFFGKQGFGLRLFKPKPDLLVSKYIQSRRSYISILVDNIDSIKGNLDKEKIHYIFNNSGTQNSFKSLLVQEPSLNLVQFIENSDSFSDDINGWDMGIEWGIHHMNLESLDVRKSMNFFCDLIGMTEGSGLHHLTKGTLALIQQN